jgi:hypothetical protein
MPLYVSRADFVLDGPRDLTPRQFMALGLRLDEATLRAQLLSGDPPFDPFVRPERFGGWPPRRWARESLLRDPAAPQILQFSYESPPWLRIGDRRLERTGAVLAGLVLLFGAVEQAERSVAGAIDGATEIVQAADRFVDAVRDFGSDDALPPLTRKGESNLQLDGLSCHIEEAHDE